MSAPVFGERPQGSADVVDLGPSAGPCPLPHRTRAGAPKDGGPGHRYMTATGIRVLCDQHARTEFRALFPRKAGAR